MKPGLHYWFGRLCARCFFWKKLCSSIFLLFIFFFSFDINFRRFHFYMQCNNFKHILVRELQRKLTRRYTSSFGYRYTELEQKWSCERNCAPEINWYKDICIKKKQGILWIITQIVLCLAMHIKNRVTSLQYQSQLENLVNYVKTSLKTNSFIKQG